MRYTLKNTNGDQSLTATIFVAGFIAATVKLLLSGLTIKGFAFSEFGGVEYATALGALGAIYVMRRGQQTPTKGKAKDEQAG